VRRLSVALGMHARCGSGRVQRCVDGNWHDAAPPDAAAFLAGKRATLASEYINGIQTDVLYVQSSPLLLWRKPETGGYGGGADSDLLAQVCRQLLSFSCICCLMRFDERSTTAALCLGLPCGTDTRMIFSLYFNSAFISRE
jgi:hypothetical protein